MIEEFIEENLIKDIENFETLTDLYERYKKFCELNKIEIMTKTKLGIQLNKKCYGIKHYRMKNYKQEAGRWGVKLLPCKY